jgi:hypothetical protein
LNHFRGFLRREIDGQIYISSQSGISMQHRGETADHDIAHSRRIQYLEYGLEDRHGVILAKTHKINSQPCIGKEWGYNHV